MATPTFFTSFKQFLGQKHIDFDNDTFVMYLTNNTPNFATQTVKANLAGLGSGNGYDETGAGTQPPMVVTWAVAGTGFKLSNDADVQWTASGGNIGPFQHVVIFDDTPAAAPVDPLMLAWAVGASTTITDGNSFTVDLNATFDLFTLD